MAGPTQKQISEKYQANLAYFRQGHYMRRIRFLVFALAVVASIGGALTFRYWGKPEYLSTGPISENHARFANNCEVCHEGAKSDLLEVLPIGKIGKEVSGAKDLTVEKMMQAAGKVQLPDLEEMKNSASKMATSLSEVDKGQLLGLAEKGISYSSLALMDKACLKCHLPMGLHQPQNAAIAMRTVLKELPLVHAGACSTCHREHVGHEKMKLPDSQTCASCHANLLELARTRGSLPNDKGNPPTKAESRDIGDGVIRFLTPSIPQIKPFNTYADGHPGFAYEGAGVKDPARIKYNHVRHTLADIPQVNGHQLTCGDCHQPGGNGAFYQPVRYEKHCTTCHSLHIAPDFPEIRIPHGDSEKVRDFLRSSSLTLHFAEALRKAGVEDRMEMGKRLKEQFDNLSARGMTSAEEIERRVFYVGDPPVETDRNTPKSNKVPFFPGCAKCHELEAIGGKAPKVLATNIAERWIQRGPFTHVPHAHMQCADCHKAAQTSKLTSDILLPTQKSCAECHRPLDREKVEAAEDTLKLREELSPTSHELAKAQRKTGGVKADCQSCHSFHASPAATTLLMGEQKKK